MIDNNLRDRDTALDRTNVDLDDDDTVLDNRARDTEPATSHDVGEGAGLGAVGGAVVGAFAGGPVGAVIGAVAGGVASAAAVDVVDKHDHDYNRTVAGTDVDSDYRNHYQTNYAQTGAPYEDYSSAYNYGSTLANDPRYQNSEWDTVQTGARSDWETRSEGTWDRFKDSVRYGWDRARGRTADTGTADPNAYSNTGGAADTAVYTNTGPRNI